MSHGQPEPPVRFRQGPAEPLDGVSVIQNRVRDSGRVFFAARKSGQRAGRDEVADDDPDRAGGTMQFTQPLLGRFRVAK